jgi:hypothetical protein
MIRIVEDERDVADAFVSLEGGELLNTVGRFLFSRHQDVTKLSKVQYSVVCVCSVYHTTTRDSHNYFLHPTDVQTDPRGSRRRHR